MKHGEFVYLQQEDVIQCGGLDMDAYIECVEKSFSLYSKGLCIEEKHPSIVWRDGGMRRIAYHPAYIGGDVDVAGIKWIPSNPDNPQRLGLPRSNALTILTDPVSGYPLAVMDGKLISDMRTGAAAGVGAKYLARQGASSVALIGTGPIARTQLWAIKRVLPDITRVALYDLRPENAQKFIDEVAPQIGVDQSVFVIAASAQEAVEGADIVATATNVDLKHRYLEYGWLKPGALLINTSVNDPTFETFEKADMIVVDTRTQLEGRGAKRAISSVVAMGLVSPLSIYEMGEIINGDAAGRTRDDQIILYSPIGLGVHDLINAKRIYERALAEGVGVRLKLWDKPVWF